MFSDFGLSHLAQKDQHGFITRHFAAPSAAEKMEWIHVCLQLGAHLLEPLEPTPSVTWLALRSATDNRKLAIDPFTGELMLQPHFSDHSLFWFEQHGPEEVCILSSPTL